MVDPKPKFQISQEGNPRGKDITVNEIKQCINDLKNWFISNCKPVQVELEKTKPASTEEIQKLAQKLKLKIPESIMSLYQEYNGNFQLVESFKTIPIKQIIENLEHYEISGYWNKNYLPFAIDSDNNVLLIEVDNGKEQKLISWNTDIGVVEVVNENFGLYLERLRDGVLKKKFEFIEDVGLVEIE